MKHRKRRIAFLLATFLMLSPLSALAQAVDIPKDDPKTEVVEDTNNEEPRSPEEAQVEKEPASLETESPEASLEMDDAIPPEEKTVLRGPGGGSSVDVEDPHPVNLDGIQSFVIEKVNEKGEAMSVVFKVTNLATKESHIVVTDNDGLSGTIYPSVLPGDGYGYSGMTIEYTTQAQIETLIQSFDEDELNDNPDRPDIFGESDSIQHSSTAIPAERPEGMNLNDTCFKDDGSVDEDRLKKGYGVYFEDPSALPDKITRTMTLRLQFGAPWDQSPVTVDYEYGETSEEDLKKIDENKIIAFAKKRLAAMAHAHQIETTWGSGVKADVIVQDSRDIYEFQELPTTSNQGYVLKTFYVQNARTGLMHVGERLGDINTTSDRPIYEDPENPGQGVFDPSAQSRIGYVYTMTNNKPIPPKPDPDPDPNPNPKPDPKPNPNPNPNPNPTPNPDPNPTPNPDPNPSPKPEVPHVHVPVKVSMPPVRIPTAGVGR